MRNRLLGTFIHKVRYWRPREISIQPPPMIVYKYVRAEFGIQAIKDESLKVGIADQQNDIFDCFPLIQAGESPHEKDDRELTNETIKELATWYGVVSFSEEPDNLLLWAHYGNSHQGMALGFDFPNDPVVVVEGAEPVKLAPTKVNYHPDRVIVCKDEIDRIADGFVYDKHKALFETAFSAKGCDWAYEKEYRHFIPLKICNHDEDTGLYFAGYPRRLIRDVVLGARCTVDVDDVYQAFYGGDRHQHFQIFRAERNQEKFKMKIVPYNVNPENVNMNIVPSDGQPGKTWFWAS